MATHRLLNRPEAQRFADLGGITHDLGTVIEFCDLMIAAYDATPPQYELIDALSTASVVRYCRCFETGVRAKVARESIGSLAPAFVKLHDYLFLLRQKHLVHPVNEFEANHVAVVVPDDPTASAPRDITLLGGRVAGLDRPTALHLKSLATVLQRAANAELDVERARLLELVSSLSPEQLSTLPEPPQFTPDWTRVGEKQSRHRQ